MKECIITRMAKEEIKFLHFPKDDVLFIKDEQKTRMRSLNNAISLGNLDHQKVKIQFQDVEGTKQVETTIWGLTDKDVILKQGTTIPIHRIIKVNLI